MNRRMNIFVCIKDWGKIGLPIHYRYIGGSVFSFSHGEGACTHRETDVTWAIHTYRREKKKNVISKCEGAHWGVLPLSLSLFFPRADARTTFFLPHTRHWDARTVSFLTRAHPHTRARALSARIWRHFVHQYHHPPTKEESYGARKRSDPQLFLST